MAHDFPCNAEAGKRVCWIRGGRTKRPWPKKAHGVTEKSINDVTDLDANEEIALWCKAWSSGPTRMTVPVMEMAKEADYAVVLKLVPVRNK